MDGLKNQHIDGLVVSKNTCVCYVIIGRGPCKKIRRGFGTGKSIRVAKFR